MAALQDWRKEFGDDYDVPHEVTARFIDQSWHNDISPSFAHREVPVDERRDLRLWVEHPDPARREFPHGCRFVLVDGEDVVLETDDLMAALDGFDAYVVKTRPPTPEPRLAQLTVAQLHDITTRALSVIEVDNEPDEHMELRGELRAIAHLCEHVIATSHMGTAADVAILEREHPGCVCQQFGKSAVPYPSGKCMVCGEPSNPNLPVTGGGR
jgi:hypothetical protein